MGYFLLVDFLLMACLLCPVCDCLCCRSIEGKSELNGGVGGGVDRCPYGDFLRDSRRVTGPSSSSPVYQIINGPRQQKKIVSQNNTHIVKNM